MSHALAPGRQMLGITVVNWNVEWATAKSPRGHVIAEKIAALQPDVVCLTESHSDFFSTGNVVTAGADYGCGEKQTRRKVVLWSPSPWTNVDRGETSQLPSGRYIAATTQTAVGAIHFIGVCIPWKDAHVRYCQKNRRPWEDHETFLRELPNVAGFRQEGHRILLGDFNQTIPRTKAPEHLSERLKTIVSGLNVATSGNLTGAPGLAIDHVCHSPGLSCSLTAILPKRDEEGRKLSDHFGISVRVGVQSS